MASMALVALAAVVAVAQGQRLIPSKLPQCGGDVTEKCLQNGCSGDWGPHVWCNQNEYIPYDGYFHNFAEPTWGGIDQPYARKLVTAYEDTAGFVPSGTSSRPVARFVSRGLLSGPSGHGSYRRRTALMTFFGQQVVEEVLDTQVSGCTPEYFNIPIPAGDDLFDPMGNGDVFIPLLRSRYAADTGNAPNNPRQQLNLITPFFDGNLLYGENKFVADALRSFRHGMLVTNDSNDLSFQCGSQQPACPSKGRTALGYKGIYPEINTIGLPIANPAPPADQWPEIVDEVSANGGRINNLVNGGRSITRVYMIGGLRANENPMLLSWGIFLFRLHNRFAYIEQQHLCHDYCNIDTRYSDKYGGECTTDDPFDPGGDESCYNWLSSQPFLDEEIYAVARMWVISVHQHIVAHEWIPAFIGAERCINSMEQDYVESQGKRCGLPAYTHYDEDIYPQVSEIFQTAAMRFGHTFVTPGIFLRQTKVTDASYTMPSMATGPTYDNPDYDMTHGNWENFVAGGQYGSTKAAQDPNNIECQYTDQYSSLDYAGHNAPKETRIGQVMDQQGTVRTANSFLRGPEFMFEHGWEAIIQGLASQVAEREDNTITPDLRGFVFGFNDFTRRDLMTVNIQRARDHGLPDYVTARLAFELEAPGLHNPYHESKEDDVSFKAMEETIAELRLESPCIDFCCQTSGLEITSTTNPEINFDYALDGTTSYDPTVPLGGKGYNARNLNGQKDAAGDVQPLCVPINTFAGNPYWLSGWAGPAPPAGDMDDDVSTSAYTGGNRISDPIYNDVQREIERYINSDSECYNGAGVDPYAGCGICDVMCSIHGGPGPLHGRKAGEPDGDAVPDMMTVDIWTGGMMETTKNGVGDLFYEAITDVYGRARDGDRFWFQNTNQSPGSKNGFFDDKDIRSILDYNMADLLRDIARPDYERCDDNGDCSIYTFSVQDEPFIASDVGLYGAVCIQPNQLSGEQYGRPGTGGSGDPSRTNADNGPSARTFYDDMGVTTTNPVSGGSITDTTVAMTRFRSDETFMQGNLQKPPLGWAADAPAGFTQPACGEYPQKVNRVVTGSYWFSAGFNGIGNSNGDHDSLNAPCEELRMFIGDNLILPTVVTECYNKYKTLYEAGLNGELVEIDYAEACKSTLAPAELHADCSHECDLILLDSSYQSLYTACRNTFTDTGDIYQNDYQCQDVAGNHPLTEVSNFQHLDYYITSKYHIAVTCGVVAAATLAVFGLALWVTIPAKQPAAKPKEGAKGAAPAAEKSGIYRSVANFLGGNAAAVAGSSERSKADLEEFANAAFRNESAFKFSGERSNAAINASELAIIIGEKEDSTLAQNLFNLAKGESPRLEISKLVEFISATKKLEDTEHIIDFLFGMIAGDKDHMHIDDFVHMIETSVKSINYPLQPEKTDELKVILSSFVIPQVTLDASKDRLDKSQFHKFVATAFLQDDISEAALEKELHNKDGFLGQLTLKFFKNTLKIGVGKDRSKTQHTDEPDHWREELYKTVVLHKLNIFWFLVYMITLFGVCGERAYYYSHTAETGGLRHVTGYGVTVTRFAASGLMMNFSFVLFPVAQNFWTLVHDTPFGKFLPLDNYLEWHIFIGIMAALYSAIHTLGHFVNFYNLATQPNFDINCLFREVYITSHKLQSFAGYWLFGTMTGCTGWLLVVVLVIFYCFAMPIVQQKGKAYFKAVHTTLYPVIMLLIILHGAGQLVQEAQFYFYFLAPAILFAIDILLRISHTGHYAAMTSDTAVLKYNPPVIQLVLRKPFGWKYRAGQHARISCPAAQLGRNIIGAARDKFRPFTISSAPTENTISFHIEVHPVRSGGSGWTVNLMEVINKTKKIGAPFPPVLLDGPYGGTHQHYDENNKALVLLASGIGMTPFASIVKDLLFKIKVGKATGRPLDLTHVHMLWSCRELKQTSWFISVLKQIDTIDVDGIVHPALFVSRSGGKSDCKLALLYILERWLGKHESPEGHAEGERSHVKTFLTGTRFRIHFERMPMLKLINKLAGDYAGCNVGIYACGGPGFLAGLRKAYGKAGRPFGQLHDEPFY